jgi:S-adenosylmethionine hydrolase
VSAVHELTDPRYRLEPLSSTFHGRDLFAPAAAYLATDVQAAELGDELDPDSLVRLPGPVTNVSGGRFESDVTRVDWYGNLQLAATGGSTFADAEPGELVVYVDSGGHVAVARNGGSARELLQDPERVVVTAKT